MTYWEEDAKRVIDSIETESFSGKRILITGASGLIGVSLVNVFSNLKPSSRPMLYGTYYSSVNRILSRAQENGCVSLYECDLTSPDFFKKLEGSKYDIIIHAAGYGQPGRFLEDKLRTIRINTYSTDQLFALLAPRGKFVYLSTSELYSGNPNMPYTESQIGTTNTNHPRASYIESKRCGEAICDAYLAEGFSTISARLALAYGPGTQLGDKRVLNNFIEKALRTNKIALLDSGTAMRTYAYVSDIVEIILKMSISEKNGIYNLGGESRISIAELAKKIGLMIGVDVSFPEQACGLKDAPNDVRLNLENMKNSFSKSQFIDLDTGLKNTIDWQRELYFGKSR